MIRSCESMLKLKYLFNDENLAEMILGNWEFDKESMDLFQYYRISSNAIIHFHGKVRPSYYDFPQKQRSVKVIF
jgi:hypothetical protein